MRNDSIVFWCRSRSSALHRTQCRLPETKHAENNTYRVVTVGGRPVPLQAALVHLHLQQCHSNWLFTCSHAKCALCSGKLATLRFWKSIVFHGPVCSVAFMCGLSGCISMSNDRQYHNLNIILLGATLQNKVRLASLLLPRPAVWLKTNVKTIHMLNIWFSRYASVSGCALLLCYTPALCDFGAKCNSAYLVVSHEYSGPL